MEKNHFFVACHVSPFVRRYLEINFGYVGRCRNNFDIRQDTGLYKYFRTLCSSEPLLTHEKQGSMFRWRTEIVNIEISEFYAEHQGRTMTVTEQNKFADYLEARCKNILRTYMNSLGTIIPNEAERIRLFYNITGWSEKTWPSKSIRKIIERDRKSSQSDFKDISSIRGVFERVAEICNNSLTSQNCLTKLGSATYEYNSNNM